MPGGGLVAAEGSNFKFSGDFPGPQGTRVSGGTQGCPGSRALQAKMAGPDPADQQGRLGQAWPRPELDPWGLWVHPARQVRQGLLFPFRRARLADQDQRALHPQPV